MKKTCVLVAHGLRRDNVRLQPWRYVYELALRFATRQPVVIITDAGEGAGEEVWEGGVKVVRCASLSPRSANALRDLINGYDPDQVWWSATPRSIVYRRLWKQLSCPVTALVTCPLYPWRLLIRAWVYGVPWTELGALMKQRVIPRWMFARLLSHASVSGVVTQSNSNRDLLVKAGVPGKKVTLIPVGIDRQDRAPVEQARVQQARDELGFPSPATVFLYLGAVRRIRGIYALLDAFAIAARRDQNIFLGVLARGADETLCGEVRAYCAGLGIERRVKVIGGWLTREQVWAFIEASDVVTLPFLLVPSDVPIAILEALARGKPVIASNVDGIPELVRGRGAVVDPLDKMAFAAVIFQFSDSEQYRREMSRASAKFMETYPDWGRVGDLALAQTT